MSIRATDASSDLNSFADVLVQQSAGSRLTPIPSAISATQTTLTVATASTSPELTGRVAPLSMHCPRSLAEARSLIFLCETLDLCYVPLFTQKSTLHGSEAERAAQAEQCLRGSLREKVKRVTTLAFWPNQPRLQHLPPEIGLFTALRCLQVYGNPIPRLPPEIGSCQQLRDLHVTHAKLQALPPEIGTLSQLEELSVGHNHLTAIPSEIGRLTNLLFLDLCSNQLTSLPFEIVGLPSLKTLLVSNNPLGKLPEYMDYLEALEFLNVDGCGLADLFPDMEGSFPSLKFLSIESNILRTFCLREGQFPNLKRVYISREQPLVLPPDLLKRQEEGKFKVKVEEPR